MRLAQVLLVAAAIALAQPSITTLTPASTTAGAPAFTLSVTGTGFVAGAAIRFGSRSLAATFLSPTQLSVQIPADLVQLAAAVSVTVENPGQIGSSSAALFFVREPMAFVTLPTLMPAQQGRFYTQAIAVAGGAAPYRFDLVQGTLPSALSLNTASGALAGFPSQEGNHRFTIRVTDTAGASLSQEFRLSVVRELTISTESFPAAVVGRAYSVNLIATGGIPPYRWSLAAGSLPSGVSMSSEGLLGGFPGISGSFLVTLQVRDAAGLSASASLVLVVRDSLAIVAAGELQQAGVGAPYAMQWGVSGGQPPLTWRVSSGALPPGLGLNSTSGLIDGVPLSSGTYRFQIHVSDATGQSAVLELSIAVAARISLQSGGALPAAVVGQSYAASVGVSGGIAPFTWRLATGALPSGLQLDGSSGQLRGTPALSGSYRFALEVTDAAGSKASADLQLLVSLPAAPLAVFTGIGPVAASAQQLPLELTIPQAYPAEITGTLSLQFSPDAASASDDSAIQFSIGGRAAFFRIPAGSTRAAFDVPVLALQTGTVAGELRLEARWSAQNQRLDPAPSPLIVRIGRQPPSIDSVQVVRNEGGFEVVVIGFSNSRELTSTVFRFQASSGADLRTTEITVPMTPLAAPWFFSFESRPFGGLFRYRQNFIVQGERNATTGVSVTLRNAEGASEPKQALF